MARVSQNDEARLSALTETAKCVIVAEFGPVFHDNHGAIPSGLPKACQDKGLDNQRHVLRTVEPSGE